jgi:hypothetical protein
MGQGYVRFKAHLALRALTALIDLFSEEVIGNDEAVLTARD